MQLKTDAILLKARIIKVAMSRQYSILFSRNQIGFSCISKRLEEIPKWYGNDDNVAYIAVQDNKIMAI